MTVVAGRTSVTSGASGSAGRPVGLARSWRRDTASHTRPPDIRPVDGLEEGIDERLLRELAERVRCERLRHNLQWPDDPQTGGCSLGPVPAGAHFAPPPQSECRRRTGRPGNRIVHRSPGGVNAIPPAFTPPGRSNAPRRGFGPVTRSPEGGARAAPMRQGRLSPPSVRRWPALRHSPAPFRPGGSATRGADQLGLQPGHGRRAHTGRLITGHRADRRGDAVGGPVDRLRHGAGRVLQLENEKHPVTDLAPPLRRPLGGDPFPPCRVLLGSAGSAMA